MWDLGCPLRIQYLLCSVCLCLSLGLIGKDISPKYASHIAWMNITCISDDNQGNKKTERKSHQCIWKECNGLSFSPSWIRPIHCATQNWYWVYHMMYKIELIFLFALKFLKALHSIIGMFVLFWINFFSEGRLWGERKLTFNEQLPYARHFIYVFSLNSH